LAVKRIDSEYETAVDEQRAELRQYKKKEAVEEDLSQGH
jgi:hypothetical protein